MILRLCLQDMEFVEAEEGEIAKPLLYVLTSYLGCILCSNADI